MSQPHAYLADRRYLFTTGHSHRSYFSPAVQAASAQPSQWQQNEAMGRSSNYSSSNNAVASTSFSANYDYAEYSSQWQDSLHKVSRGSTQTFDYSQSSSQRPIQSTSPRILTQAVFPTVSEIDDPPRSPSQSSSYNHWDDQAFEGSSSSRPPSTAPTPSSKSSVKIEPDDAAGCFIMELSAPQVRSTMISQSLAPPTEVPLRATQAPEEMRGMMTVFRLNPFAMHSGEGRGLVPSPREAPHALEEEPLIFEFQLDLDGVHISSDDELPPNPEQPKDELLRSFSPDFELHDGREEGDQSDWGGYRSSGSSVYPSTPPTWDLEYPATGSDDQFSSSEPVSAGLHHARQPSRLHNSLSHPYLRKIADQHHHHHRDAESQGYYPSSGVHTGLSSISGSNRMISGTEWSGPSSRSGYVPTSRSSTYASDSPGRDPAVLPSIMSVNRRWSLPDTNQALLAPFLV
ncbi:hypothetical protein Hypma_014153 [Hypsizygus marmoreus]|uniref:Uncharacterized protein n=1 Tax=Hypsizygus marmoreus TaxID=39966 RepID=A0A369KAP8_HYPMA|nr:hypothetical protein Hypma_014153 [Hypsizygus marmoreus]